MKCFIYYLFRIQRPLNFNLSVIQPVTKILLFHHKQPNAFCSDHYRLLLYSYFIILFIIKKKKRTRTCCFTLFSGCTDPSKKAQTGFPTFPKQLNLLYCFAFACCHITIPKQKTWGKKKKKVYSLPTILLYENGTIASLSGDVTPPECVTFSLYNNKEFAP